MLPCNYYLLYDIFYVALPYSQRVTNVVICYNNGIIVATRVIMVGYICCCYYSTTVLWVPDNLNWLRLFMSVCILYAINNCDNELVLFRVTLFVVTEAVVLVVFLFLLLRSFTTCYIAGSFSIRCWLLQLSHDHYSFPYHLLGSFMSTPCSLWFLFPLPLPPQPPPPTLPRPLPPSNWPPMPPLSPIPDELTCPLRLYPPGDVCIDWKKCDITADKYVEDVSKLAMWLDL